MDNIEERLENLKNYFQQEHEILNEEKGKEYIKENFPDLYKLHNEYQEILQWAFGQTAERSLSFSEVSDLWKKNHPDAPDLILPEITAIPDLTSTYIFIQIMKYKLATK